MIIGVLAPLLGTFIVVRRLSLIADALSHVTLAGISASLLLSQKIGFMQGVNPVYLGMVSSVTGALLSRSFEGSTSTIKSWPFRLFYRAELVLVQFVSRWQTVLIMI